MCAHWQAGFYHRNAIFSGYVDVPLQQLLEEGPRQPKTLRMVATEDISAGIAATADVSARKTPRGSRADDVSRQERSAADCAADLSNGTGSNGSGTGAEGNAAVNMQQGINADGGARCSKGPAARDNIQALLTRSFQHALDIRSV